MATSNKGCALIFSVLSSIVCGHCMHIMSRRYRASRTSAGVLLRGRLAVLLVTTCSLLFNKHHGTLVSAQRQAGDPVTTEEGLEDAFACSQQALTPLNKLFFLTDGIILSTLYSITSCSEANLQEDGIGPCLYDLGFEGIEEDDDAGDWTCANAIAPNTCSGLKCDQYHKGSCFQTNNKCCPRVIVRD